MQTEFGIGRKVLGPPFPTYLRVIPFETKGSEIPDAHPARNAGGMFLTITKLRGSDATWEPNAETIYEGRHHDPRVGALSSMAK
jgi:hypothetical protein